MDRADIVHQNFIERISKGDLPGQARDHAPAEHSLSNEKLLELLRSQMTCRHLDRISRKLQARGEGYYTIGSSGHEGMAAIAEALRVSDPAFLHYRDGAFQIQRANQVSGQTPIWDFLLSFTTSSEDPISGGRHKVLGSKTLNIPPQTSTIASHLPKAVGAAYSIGLAKRLTPEHQAYPDDAIVYCSFGDASLNHSTAQGAINTAAWTAFQNIPMPLLFACEDNGIGISTKTPTGWVNASMADRKSIHYEKCNGLDLIETYQTAQRLCEYVRRHKKPAFLHVSTVRLYGHAGADAQQAYMSRQEIEATEANDPLLHSARILVEHGIATREEILKLYNDLATQIECSAEQVLARPKLATSAEVMASIIPPKRDCNPTNGPSETARQTLFGDSDLKSMQSPLHMAKQINLTLNDLMLEHIEIVLAGEDIGPKGGVYGVTQKLHHRFGAHRVINTVLDEQSILGLSIGLAQNGLIPIPEIQFLAYLHNAEDQLRGEAATLSFFSNGQFTNPMVIRIAGLGYQRGFGGHFHNDNSIAVLRDIPGVILACPSNGYDAALMLRECVRLAREEQRVVVFLEPIALYMVRDLHGQNDNGWTQNYPQPGSDEISQGQVGEFKTGKGKDLTIISYGNGYYFSRQAEKILHEKHGLELKLIDLRWLSPLPSDELLKAVSGSKHILVVDECRASGSISEAIITLLATQVQSTDPKIDRLTADDSFIATGPAYNATLPTPEKVIAKALNLIGKTNG